MSGKEKTGQVGHKPSYIHEVDISVDKATGKKWIMKIDGKEFGSTCGVVIRSPMANEDGMTTVEIKFYAEVKGKILADKVTETIKGVEGEILSLIHI